MRKSAVALIVACLVAVAAPALADVAGPHQGQALALSADKIAKIKIQIGLHENRAKELQPLLARATQEHTDTQADATTLESQAKDLRDQAAAFRAMTNEPDCAPKVKSDFTTFAREVEQQAKNNDEQAKTLHDASRKLESVMKFEQHAIQFHLDMAAKLKASLAANS